MSGNQDGLSDFMKFVYAHDGVKDLSEAFKEFPPEEEWHEGKVEKVIKHLKENGVDVKYNKSDYKE